MVSCVVQGAGRAGQTSGAGCGCAGGAGRRQEAAAWSVYIIASHIHNIAAVFNVEALTSLATVDLHT